jgi:hypothetical protein
VIEVCRGHRGMSGALPVPMLLNGGYGYEELRLFIFLTLERWF